MCLTFPWEPRCFSLLLLPAVASWWCQCVAEMLPSCSALPLVSHSLPQSHLHSCIFNENAEASQSVLHMQLQAARLRAAVYLYQQPPPCYHCLHPAITASTLPSLFYYSLSPIIQVLHLMNKMNLPCPFGPVTARPPMVSLYSCFLDRQEQDNGWNSLQIHVS